MTDEPKDLLIEEAVSAFRERNSWGRVLPSPAWWDLPPGRPRSAVRAPARQQNHRARHRSERAKHHCPRGSRTAARHSKSSRSDLSARTLQPISDHLLSKPIPRVYNLK